jgi:hypothetical protein
MRVWSPDGTLLHEEALGGWPRALAFDPTGAHLAAVTDARPPRLTIFAIG